MVRKKSLRHKAIIESDPRLTALDGENEALAADVQPFVAFFENARAWLEWYQETKAPPTKLARFDHEEGQRAKKILQAIHTNRIEAARFLERWGVSGQRLLAWATGQQPEDYLGMQADLDLGLAKYLLAIEESGRRLELFRAELLQPEQEKEAPVIYSLGNCIYRVGDGRPYEVNDQEDAILQAFRRRPAMSEKTLSRETKNTDARTILVRMLEKYDGVFAAVIHRPPGKSSGGYCATVRAVGTK